MQKNKTIQQVIANKTLLQGSTPIDLFGFSVFLELEISSEQVSRAVQSRVSSTKDAFSLGITVADGCSFFYSRHENYLPLVADCTFPVSNS